MPRPISKIFTAIFTNTHGTYDIRSSMIGKMFEMQFALHDVESCSFLHHTYTDVNFHPYKNRGKFDETLISFAERTSVALILSSISYFLRMHICITIHSSAVA